MLNTARTEFPETAQLRYHMTSLHGREPITLEDTAVTSFIAQDEFVVAHGVTVKLQDGTVLNNTGFGGFDINITTNRLTSSKPNSYT